MEELLEKVKLALDKIKGATKMVSGWSRTEDSNIERLRMDFIQGYQEQILKLCQAFEGLHPFVKGYILVTTDLPESIKGFEEAIAVYYPELEEA